jgi:hypothetical protein
MTPNPRPLLIGNYATEHSVARSKPGVVNATLSPHEAGTMKPAEEYMQLSQQICRYLSGPYLFRGCVNSLGAVGTGNAKRYRQKVTSKCARTEVS